ncbi:hypothetical protein D1F64_21280 [Breoghania sp. L-A4]|nr:hypothetical protein D1F64_21280 [Breoghania sp. L-A4]
MDEVADIAGWQAPEFQDIAGLPTGDQWSRVKRQLRAELGEDVSESWFGRVDLESDGPDETVLLSVPTRFLKQWLQAHYYDLLLKLWKLENRKVNQIEFIVRRKGLEEDHRKNIPSAALIPPEPDQGPGPQYGVQRGRLSEKISFPKGDESARQAGLHKRLKANAASLARSLKASNRYVELAAAAEEYALLLDEPVESSDVTGLWAVGGALSSFAQSYRDQNVGRTFADPLEPQLEALLLSVSRQHGAFIMGFEEGRDLVNRADEYALDPARLGEIALPGNEILRELTENRELVDERTRALHRPVRDSAAELGWSTSRVGYSAYLIVRNGVRAMIKFSVGENPNLGTVLGILAGAL